MRRAEWASKILRLSQEQPPFSHPGVILIQIDGFSQTELKHAMDKGRMPFLKSLLQTGAYTMNTLFSGYPSVTPAVQGEILYGVKACEGDK